VATGCSSCNNSAAVLVEQFYTGLMNFVGWSSVLSFTEAHGGFLNYVKICETDHEILSCIGLHSKCVASGTGHAAT